MFESHVQHNQPARRPRRLFPNAIYATVLFYTACTSPELTVQDIQDNVETLSHLLDSEDKSLPFLSVQEQQPTPTPPKSIPKLLSRPELLAIIQKKWPRLKPNALVHVGC